MIKKEASFEDASFRVNHGKAIKNDFAAESKNSEYVNQFDIIYWLLGSTKPITVEFIVIRVEGKISLKSFS